MGMGMDKKFKTEIGWGISNSPYTCTLDIPIPEPLSGNKHLKAVAY